MSIMFFEGAAGTGKTKGLIAALEAWLECTPLSDGQAVLALTFMHGSRHRLARRLAGVRSTRRNHECITIDSFAWKLVMRWRGLLTASEPCHGALSDRTFDERCAAAARLLEDEYIRKWVCRRFPVIVADELQDVRDSRLCIIQRLSQTGHIIGAADEFQDLGEVGENPAVAWLREMVTPIVLERNHRTNCADLLDSAAELRSGRSMRDRTHCKHLSAPNANTAASFVARNLTWGGIPGTAILTPTSPEKSAFVRNTVERLLKPIKPGGFSKEVGPFRIPWESHPSHDARRLLSALELGENVTGLSVSGLRVPPVRGGRSLQDWIDRQRRVFGRTQIPVEVLRREAERVCQQLRARRPTHDDHVVAMTIHQAKNREFNRVIILWPYEVSGCPEKLRRLLYNAVTRAKERAVIIVQNPPTAKPSRLAIPPFVAEERPSG